MGRYLELAKLIGVELGEFFEFKYEREVYLRVIKEDGIYDIDRKYDFNFIDNYFNGYIEIIKYGSWINELEEVIARIKNNISDLEFLDEVDCPKEDISNSLNDIAKDIKELTIRMKEVKR